MTGKKEKNKKGIVNFLNFFFFWGGPGVFFLLPEKSRPSKFRRNIVMAVAPLETPNGPQKKKETPPF